MNYVEKIIETRTNKQLYNKVLLVISLIVSIAGLVIITNSVSWGDDAASAAVSAQGGSMDTAKSLVILQESTSSYRTMGALLLLIGGAGCLMSIKFLEKQKNIGDDL